MTVAANIYNVPKDDIIRRVEVALLPLRITDGADATTRKNQRRAAVLMPFLFRDGEWHIILTQRPLTMPRHPGQIAFPGGRVEEGERALHAALRETREEIGIDPTNVTPLGRLPSFDAMSGFRVTPFVGIICDQAVITPDPREVDDVFDIPFKFFMNPTNHKPRHVELNNEAFIIYDMPYEGPDGIHRNVWGMTAMMLYRLWQRGFTHDAY